MSGPLKHWKILVFYMIAILKPIMAVEALSNQMDKLTHPVDLAFSLVTLMLAQWTMYKMVLATEMETAVEREYMDPINKVHLTHA